jgi:hypothetical protein
MADRYQDRPFPADDDYDRGDDPHAPARAESDPLAELARLIGQTDPFSSMGRANLPVQPRSAARDQYQHPPAADDADDEGPAAGPPPWMQRAARQEAPPPQDDYQQDDYQQDDYQNDYPSAVHPLQRHAAPASDYHQAPPFADAEQEPDPSRYDDALFGQLDTGEASRHDPAYTDDPYAYQDGYGDGSEDPVQKRRGGMVTVVVVLALAVVGTGAAFAYRTYIGSPRTGEPPIIRADTGPTKIVPAPSDAGAKVPDRMAAGDGTEKIVSREEAPVDVNSKTGPRVVFPPLNQVGAPPPMANVTPGVPATSGNGTLPNNEPRKIKTFSVRGDQPDGAAAPVTSATGVKPASAAKSAATPPAAAPRATPPSAANANASSANTPLSLAPQATPQATPPAPSAEPRTRVAATNPTPQAASSGGGYLVQVSSQRNEADAQASYKALQGKFPAVLGSHAPVIKRADLGDKGVYYRAMVGPFGSPEEASQFCGSLKTAGGQCVVQRN